MRLGPFLAKRYIAGIEINDALRRALELNRHGIGAAIDNLGEDVTERAEAEAALNEYSALLGEIAKARADASISLKLTHLGLDVSRELALENAGQILTRAARLGNSVRFDMEGSRHTQRIIDAFLELRATHENAGIAIQSYLRRSAEDVRLLIKRGASVRLVKGAYKEGADIAFPEKKAVDANFDALMKELLLNGNQPAIATHDERLIDEAKRFAREKGVSKDRFSFEMLLGIKRPLQTRLVEEGYRVRVYVPYGGNWLPYTMRRLRERKENIWFVVKNFFD
ncbi:MAG: proline dehydrogenase family protein [Deltaproteobacteria bacterium]|nr:proline dehydrogenase family protein [Deltaproteobacteria bacterium]